MSVIRWFDNNLEQLVVSVCTLAMIAVLAVNVFLRFLFGHSISESEELARYLFLYAVFSAASLAAQKDAHIRVTAFTDPLPQRFLRPIIVIADSIWLAFNLFVVWSGWELVASMFEFPYRSPALGLPMQYVYMVVPLCFSGMCFRIIQRYYRRLRYGWEAGTVEKEVTDL